MTPALRPRDAPARAALACAAFAAWIWDGDTPMSDGRLKKANPASTPRIARVKSTAVNMLTMTPRISVTAKPLGCAVAKMKSTTAVSIVRMFASRIVLKPSA